MIDLSSPATQRRLLAFAIISILLFVALSLPQIGAAQDAPLPATTPEALPGLDLFAARCANCHGPTGQGDGPLIQQSGAPPPMPFNENYLRAAVPSAMFEQITNGDPAAGMPPFGPTSSNPIDEAGRWNLVAAVYSLATPPENIDAGRAIYEANCAACHGDEGRGDGPDAATTEQPPSNLSDAAYWFNRSNQTVFDELAPGAISAHSYNISEDDLWRVVDYARAFSYVYADPVILTAPIAEGTIFGTLSNGATGERLADSPVTLRAFTPEFAEALALTTTTDSNGNFLFDVTEVAPNLVYIVGATFNDLNFSSNAGQLNRDNTTLELPVTVFDKSSDATGVGIGQLHVIMEFAEDRVRVNELYVINNNQNAVYVGPTGDPAGGVAQGVIEIAVPDGAENLTFQRSFGSVDSFVPADDFVQTARGWADPLPLRPGEGALTLLAQYELPYSDGMTITHPVFYETATSTIILPDTGVQIVSEPWVEQPPQTFGQGETYLNYSGPGVRLGESLAIELSGRPSVVTDAGGAAVVNRDVTTELLIGGGTLLLAAVGGVFLWRSWQRNGRDETEDDAALVVAGDAADVGNLLQSIADLDDTLESGGIDETTYQTRRAELKRQLVAIWIK